MPTNEQGSILSGRVYVAAVMRHPEEDQGGMSRHGRPTVIGLIIRERENCTTHPEDGKEQVSSPTICVDCAESWSWDHDLMFWRTVGGRAMAGQMGLDPMTAGKVLRERDGYEARIKELGRTN